jgi:hypothetical protein
MVNNPFENCRPEQNGKGQWGVSSDFWFVPCADEKSARRMFEIVQGAYSAGVEDMRGRFNALLNGEDYP